MSVPSAIPMKTGLPFFSLLVAACCVRAAETPPPDVIGQAGSLRVTAAEVKETLAALGEAGVAAGGDPAAAGQLVRSLLAQRLLLREAEEAGYERRPETAARLARAREVALTESWLESVSAPPAGYPSEAELKTAYESARPQLALPRTWRLAQIFVALPKDAGTEAASAAEQKLTRIREALRDRPTEFAALAAQHSEESESAGRGGEIGWLEEKRIQPAILERLAGLKVESLTEPVRLDDGWHIVKLLDVREPRTPPLEEVRRVLVQRLRAEKARANSEAHLAALLRRHPVAINELALAELLRAAAPAAAPASQPTR
jgi:peptidylprolyl isomerase